MYRNFHFHELIPKTDLSHSMLTVIMNLSLKQIKLGKGYILDQLTYMKLRVLGVLVPTLSHKYANMSQWQYLPSW